MQISLSRAQCRTICIVYVALRVLLNLVKRKSTLLSAISTHLVLFPEPDLNGGGWAALGVQTIGAWALAILASGDPPSHSSLELVDSSQLYVFGSYLLNPLLWIVSSTHDLEGEAITIFLFAAAARRWSRCPPLIPHLLVGISMACCPSLAPFILPSLPLLWPQPGGRGTVFTLSVLISALLGSILRFMDSPSWWVTGSDHPSLIQPSIGLQWYLAAEAFPQFRPVYRFVFAAMPGVLQALVCIRFPTSLLESLCCQMWIGMLFASMPSAELVAVCMTLSAAVVLRSSGGDISQASAWQGGWLALLALQAALSHVWLNLGGANANFLYGANVLWALSVLIYLQNLLCRCAKL